MRAVQPYTFESAKEQWSKPPVDNVGYLNSDELLAKSDKELKELMITFESNRFALDGWRNFENKWADLLGLDGMSRKIIMDFGCGIGLESMIFTRNHNLVISVDISTANLKLTKRVIELNDCRSAGTTLCSDSYPYFKNHGLEIDVFHANGVLHHTPLFREILERVCEVLNSDGWIQLMLYSDKGWKKATGVDAPPRTKACDHPLSDVFVAHFDGVGFYADWFSKDKIEWMVGDFLTIDSFDYICDDERYCIVKLRKK